MDDAQSQYMARHWAWAYVDIDGFHSVGEFTPDGSVNRMAADFGADGAVLYENRDVSIYALRPLNVSKEIVDQYDASIDMDDSISNALFEQCPDLEPWLMRRPFFANPPIESSDPHRSRYILFGNKGDLGYGVLVSDFPALLTCLNSLRCLC